MAQSPKQQRQRIPSVNKTVKFPKSPKDQKARNETKPKAKNNSTQELRFLSFHKKKFHTLWPLQPSQTFFFPTCLTTFHTPSATFIDLLTHSGITVTHFQSLFSLMMGWTTLKLSIWQLKILKSANTEIKEHYHFAWGPALFFQKRNFKSPSTMQVQPSFS